MNDVRLPIKTVREGDKITKICVEDVYKILNRVQDAIENQYNESMDILDSVFKEYDDYSGELIIGTGVSQPCEDDVFDEEIGNKIAFMKAKLNANLKKFKLLIKIEKSVIKTLDCMDEDIAKILQYIKKDLEGIREFNPDYLRGIEFTLSHEFSNV